MLLNNFLDLGLHFRRDVAARNLLEKTRLRGRQMLAKLGLPFRDLFHGDRVELKNEVFVVRHDDNCNAKYLQDH